MEQAKNDLQVCAVKPWDYVETISDEYLSKIKAGQTYSEVCEMIDLEPRYLASGSGIYWELGDGKRLTIFFSVKPGLDCFITTGRYTLRPAN